MKHILVIILLLLFLPISKGISQTSFAILPMEARGEVVEEDKEEAESSLYRNLIESGKYKILERTRIQQILNEQEFQQTGITDPSKTVKIGKIAGVEKLITSTIYLKTKDNFVINFSVTDVATAQVELTKQVSEKDYSANSHGRFCASLIIAEYPLVGKVLGKIQNIIVVNLGRNHKLKVGDRLFIARKKDLIGDDGEVLFQEYHRIGTLEITQLDASRAKTKIKFFENTNTSVTKNDLVSPEPIPRRESLISTTPLLSNVIKGKLLLEDNMQNKKYLSPTYNKGEYYINGKLHLNATHLETGHTYCFYPAPFDKIENFILEGEVKFQEISSKYNKFSIIFRHSGEYGEGDEYCYNLFINSDGGFQVNRMIAGKWSEIMLLRTSPYINRVNSKNNFRIVAFGSNFDCYINDTFIIGLEDELLEKGVIGFFVNSGCYSTFDNIKIWECLKK